jgi:peptidoglycan-N-acetylglucosamine deacetylase
MEGHTIRRVILHLLWIAPLGALLVLPASPIAALVMVMTSHALVLYPTLTPTSQWLGPVVTSFRTSKREVWLTIDDGPSGATPEVLDLLDRFGARATFFIVGARARQFPEATAEIVRRGHRIGNHSDSHPSASFWALPPRAIAREIDACSETLHRLTGLQPQAFRPPVGMKNPFVHPAAARRRLPVVAWSARGYDAVSSDAHAIVERVVRGLRPGAIIMVHERSRSGTQSVGMLLERLSAEEFRCIIPANDQLVAG